MAVVIRFEKQSNRNVHPFMPHDPEKPTKEILGDLLATGRLFYIPEYELIGKFECPRLEQ